MSKRFQHMILLAAVIGLIDIGRAASADVTFFLQPEASGLDGEARYLDTIAATDNLGTFELIDFDDPALFPNDSEVHELQVDSVNVRLEASLASSILAGNGHTGPYIFNPHGFYIWEGRAFANTLVMGDRATLDFNGEQAGAVGFWIFDDQRSLDSVYRIDVLERHGRQATTFVANDMDPNINNVYEIEGFVGIISDVGIRRVVVTPLDPASLLPQSDIFEIDYLSIGRLRGNDSRGGDDSSEPGKDDSEEKHGRDSDDDSSDDDHEDSDDDRSGDDKKDDSGNDD